MPLYDYHCIHPYREHLQAGCRERVIQVAVALSHTRPIARVTGVAAARAPFNKPTTGNLS